MSKRQYEQVCALSVALDILGDRWTLLIIRELLFGVRRYSDLLRGLPSLGTNLLARRLKELEQAGLITQRRLPPPAAATVYDLTPEGRDALRPIIRALTNFGVDYLQYPPLPGHFVPASSTMGAMSKFYLREHEVAAEADSYAVEFQVKDDGFYAQMENGRLHDLGFGLPSIPARLVIAATTDIIMGAVVGYVDVAEAIKNGDMQIKKGEETDAIHFFSLFEGPVTT